MLLKLSQQQLIRRTQGIHANEQLFIYSITELRNSVETLDKFVDENGNPYFVSKEERLDPNTPILFGIMYTILSPKYVVPIVDETTKFTGILSLHDIMDILDLQVQWSICINSNQEKSIIDYTKLLDALRN